MAVVGGSYIGKLYFFQEKKMIWTRFVQELTEGIKGWSKRQGLCFQRFTEKTKAQQEHTV